MKVCYNPTMSQYGHLWYVQLSHVALLIWAGSLE